MDAVAKAKALEAKYRRAPDLEPLLMPTETDLLLYRVFTLTWPAQPGRPAGRGTLTSPEPITAEEAQDCAAERIPGVTVTAVESSRVEAVGSEELNHAH